MIFVQLSSSDALDRAFAAMMQERPDAFTMTGDPFHQLHVGWIIKFVAKNRLPAMYQLRENVLAAGQGFAGWLLNRRPLPACMTVLNVIGNLLTDSCQVKELFLG